MPSEVKIHVSEPKRLSLRGVITNPGKYVPGAERLITVRTIKGNEYKCVVPISIFGNLHEDDNIRCLVTKNEKGDFYTLAEKPFITYSVARGSVEACFVRALRGTRFGETQADKLYTELVNLIKMNQRDTLRYMELPPGEEKNRFIIRLEETQQFVYGDDGVINYLSIISKAYRESGDSHSVKMLCECGLTDIQAKRLLTWWYKSRGLRRLHLLGLNNAQIKRCRPLALGCFKGYDDNSMTCDEIYHVLISDPFRLAPVPMDICFTVLQAFGMTPTAEEIRCGEIIRKIDDYIEGMSYACIRMGSLLHHFPDFCSYLSLLESEYGIVKEGKLIFTQYNLKVSTAVAQLVDKLIKDTNKLLETAEKEGISHQESLYSIKTLTDEQKNAIRGGIRDKICVITGGGGTGKCLAPDTDVLMFDGTIKLAKDIKEGDLLMGPDSNFRTVLSTCSGIEQMYTIIPSKGNSFTCNEPHVLTLKGLKPYIGRRTDRPKSYIVTYSVRSHRKRTSFYTEAEAQEFIDSLHEDIYDIPLNEYLGLPESIKSSSFLFHTGVDFGDNQVPFDPYMIGYWLGDGNSAGAKITTADPEVVTYFEENLPTYGLQMKEIGNTKMSYNISSSGENYCQKGKNKFINTLKELDLVNNKHIPLVYRMGSRKSRLALLAGLIDSDGYVNCNCIEISQKNTTLAADIEYLAFSLGFMVTSKLVWKCCTYLGQKKKSLYTKLMIFGTGLEEIPTLLPRKRLQPRLSPTRAECQRFKVLPQGEGKYCGFTLDGDGRFLLGDFLVTHNTTICKEIYTNLSMRGIEMAACAFTGKAVTRLNEILHNDHSSITARTMDWMICRAGAIKESWEDAENKDVERREKLEKLRTAVEEGRMTEKEAQEKRDRDKLLDKIVGIVPRFKVLLIDECSMVTTELFYRFTQAYTHEYSIIIMGDCNQLPPIGWGFFMKQVIACKRVPVYTLTQNQRLKKAFTSADEELKFEKELEGKAPSEIKFDRSILHNCARLIDPKRDITVPIDFEEGTDTELPDSRGFYIYEEDMSFIKDLCQQLYDGGTRYEEITCISPYTRFTAPINKIFQDVFLAEEEGYKNKDVIWKNGDRVMMLKNNYARNVMNGEEGLVTEVTPKGVRVQFKIKRNKKGVIVETDPYYELFFLFQGDEADLNANGETEVEEGKWEADELYISMIQHSACITVHKSQGSEYPYVIVYIPSIKGKQGELSSFLNINLAYVAFSRPIRTIWVIAEHKTLRDISTRRLPIRCDNLAARINQLQDPEQEAAIIAYTEMLRAQTKKAEEGSEEPDEEANIAAEDDDVPPDDDFWDD